MHYYRNTREQNYKYLTPKVIIEEFITDLTARIRCQITRSCVLVECTQLIQVDLDECIKIACNTSMTLHGIGYSTHLDLSRGSRTIPNRLNSRKCWKLLRSCRIRFLLYVVDMYVSGTEVKVGELTNCPNSASRPFSPRSPSNLHSGDF